MSQNRPGSENDVKRLESTLPSLGLALYQGQCHQDISKGEIGKLINGFAKSKVHSTGDCAVLIFMSHGNEKDEIVCAGKRSTLKIDTIIEMFSNDNAVLAEKPVLLMFACCR
jgi:hypothetical protein